MSEHQETHAEQQTAASPAQADVSDTGSAPTMLNRPELLGELPDSEQVTLLKQLLDSALDMVIAHTPEGQLVYFNDAACELLGYGQNELTQLGPYGWVGPDAMTTAPGRLEAILHQGQLEFTSTARRKDGELIPTEVCATRVDSRYGPLVVAIIRDIRDRIEAQQTILHLAYHDKLTGLGNRALFDDRIDLAMADARRFGDILGVAFVDIDRFKPVNDVHGHRVGDLVLIELARRLQSATRRQDTVARLGGDEFIVILPRIGGMSDLARVGAKLASAIRQPVLVKDGPPVELVGSIGLALFDTASDDARSLLMKADAAMYAAKDDRYRDWCVYEECMYGPLASRDEA